MEHNYADLLDRARGTILLAGEKFGTAEYCLASVPVIRELAEALITVCNQNKNLRQDLAQTKRDYEANLEELLRVGEELALLKDTIYVEVNGLRYIVDPRLKEPVVGIYDPELKEVLE